MKQENDFSQVIKVSELKKLLDRFEPDQYLFIEVNDKIGRGLISVEQDPIKKECVWLRFLGKPIKGKGVRSEVNK